MEGAFQGPWAPSGAQGSLAFRVRRPVFRKEGQQPRSVLQPWDRGLAPLRLPQLCAGPDSTGDRQLVCPVAAVPLHPPPSLVPAEGGPSRGPSCAGVSRLPEDPLPSWHSVSLMPRQGGALLWGGF